MTQVNRYLENREMDRIDHALGRPVDPLSETHRNHYAIDLDCDTAKRMAADPCWHIGKRCGDLVFFHVTDHGRRALKAHLRDVGDAHRLFEVTVDDYPLTIRAATSHGAARYDAYLDADLTDVTFGEWCKRTKVRLSTLNVRSPA